MHAGPELSLVVMVLVLVLVLKLVLVLGRALLTGTSWTLPYKPPASHTLSRRPYCNERAAYPAPRRVCMRGAGTHN